MWPYRDGLVRLAPHQGNTEVREARQVASEIVKLVMRLLYRARFRDQAQGWAAGRQELLDAGEQWKGACTSEVERGQSGWEGIDMQPPAAIDGVRLDKGGLSVEEVKSAQHSIPQRPSGVHWDNRQRC